MDDPLIGLTIYDNTRVSATTGTTRKQSKMFRKGGGDDASDECFPCLPGISEDQHVEMVKQSPKSQHLISSPPSTDSKLTALQSHAPKVELECVQQPPRKLTQPSNYWLMRLFESSLFTMSIGIGYLFKSKDRDVLSYLGGKLFVSHVSLLLFSPPLKNLSALFRVLLLVAAVLMSIVVSQIPFQLQLTM